MSNATKRVLDRLGALGFETRLGGTAPFGEELPLVSGTAWDVVTAQVAYIAEYRAADEIEAWRQLLFAGSGLRHQLAGDGPAGFGTPVVLAVVDEDGERRLRAMAEDLAQDYALFNRVDLNLVRMRDLDDANGLDLSLAPLLPRCREMLGKEISKREVKRFWSVLRDEVARTAAELPEEFAAYREEAGRDSASALIGHSAEAPELPSPSPLASIELQNFRSFAHAAIEFAPVSVVHGPNGSGKSSVLEALELAWAGRSQRQPDDVDGEEYGRHLRRDGCGEFLVRSGEREISTIAETAAADLPRSVLTQEAVAALVGSSPADRYSGLLAITGLEIPDLKTRTGALVASAKREADAALVAAGLPPLPRSDSVALRHLNGALSTAFAAGLPSDADLNGLERALAQASHGAYVARSWPEQPAGVVLTRADALAAGVVSDVADGPALIDALREAQEAVVRLAAERQGAARAARVLLDALVAQSAPTPQAETERGSNALPMPTDLAVRWLAHVQGSVVTAERFKVEAESLEDAEWARELVRYADAIQAAAEAVPNRRLERLTRAATVSAGGSPAPAVDPEAFLGAGFTRAPGDARAIIAPLRALAAELQQHGETLHGLSRTLEQHPTRVFARNREVVLRALCRFEVARLLRREGPVMRASEELVRELLQGRLAPVLRELVAAIVRFEWYFKPLQLPQGNRKVVLGGLATSQADLDARLVLNAAERNVVGLAWFLALHLLQPEERRRVLVLDDPTAGLDAVNQAGFIASFRAFVRLTRPDQVVVATHDDALAAVLSEELAPVDSWPASTTRVRCRRDPDDGSAVKVEWTESDSRATEDEAVRLGLRGERTLFA